MTFLSTNTTRLCIVRHGETDWNVAKRIQGQTDIPLNATGRAQALAMAYNAGHHHFQALYSSDLSRAQETAQALTAHLDLTIATTPGLRERHYGIFQGISAAQGAQRYPEAYACYQQRDLHYNFETGESLLAFAGRVRESLDRIIRHHVGQTVAIVTHAGVLDILYRQATGRPLETERDFVIPNCALNWFHSDGQGLHLEKWADRHHLTQVLTETPE